MRLHRLRIESFGAIGNVDVEFGPGLNVLYGPNDLGKSTAVAAIRLGLLLPHTSTHCDQYVGWTGSDDPDCRDDVRNRSAAHLARTEAVRQERLVASTGIEEWSGFR